MVVFVVFMVEVVVWYIGVLCVYKLYFGFGQVVNLFSFEVVVEYVCQVGVVDFCIEEMCFSVLFGDVQYVCGELDVLYWCFGVGEFIFDVLVVDFDVCLIFFELVLFVLCVVVV